MLDVFVIFIASIQSYTVHSPTQSYNRRNEGLALRSLSIDWHSIVIGFVIVIVIIVIDIMSTSEKSSCSEYTTTGIGRGWY